MKQSQRLHLLIMSALFAAAIAVMTAYLLHIPIPTGGYIHVGDALIYLAACLLPAPMWVVPTLVIKAVVALLFTSRSPRLLCPRNLAAAAGTCLLSPAAYGLAACLLMGSVHAFWPQFLGTLVQGVGSGVLFVVLGLALERSGLKARFSAA